MNPKILLNAARLAEKAGRTDLAKSLFDRSTNAPNQQRAEALFRLANLKVHSEDSSDVQHLFEEAVQLQPDRAAWRYRLGTVLEKSGLHDEALSHYRAAVALEPSNTRWAGRLERLENTIRIAKAKADDDRAKAFRKSGARWQELEVLLASAPNFRNSPDWFLRLGDALEAMSRFAEAAEAFARANELRLNRSENLAREAYCWLRSGANGRAESVFRRARQTDTQLGSKELGIGVFFERRGMWHEAAHYFGVDSLHSPTNLELQFRAGRAYERTYDWNESALRYRQATLLALGEPRYHLRLGFVRERMNDFAGAEKCYAYGLSLPSKTPPANYWAYRLGVVREGQGKFDQAVEAYSISLGSSASEQTELADKPKIHERDLNYESDLLEEAKHLARRSEDPDHILKLVTELESRELWKEAVYFLEAAADRSQKFNPSIYQRLGAAYSYLGDTKSAARCFRMTRNTVAPRGIDDSLYKNDTVLRQRFEYAEMLENLPLRDNVIFYESFLGKQITCNPYALFQNVLNDPKYGGFIHVWSVTAATAIPSWMHNLGNVIFVERGSYLNRRFLATAKYLVNNVTFPDYFVRRSGQKYLNTWHGTPMKTLGKDVGTGVLDHRNVARNFLQSTHIIVPNEHTARVMLERHDIDTLVTAKVAHTGYPRVDLTVSIEPADRSALLSALGISESDQRQIVLYAPTWRGGSDYKHFDSLRLVEDMKELSRLDCVVLFQGHHLSEGLLPDDLPVHIVSHEINTNELLSVVDVLITDYSSILFDFLPTRRPIICYTYDLDEYAAERGLYFTPEDLGLREARTTNELADSVRSALFDPNSIPIPSELLTRFCPNEDGRASERVKAFLFDESSDYSPRNAGSERRRFLFHHSMIPNGISSSLVNLLKSLDPETCDITLIVPAAVVRGNEGSVDILRSLPSHIKVLGDAGRQVVNAEEKWLVDYFNRWSLFASSEQKDLYLGAFGREYKRLFGDTKFDVIVEFEGYSPYWASVLAAAPGNGKKIIHLHSDMMAERNVRFPYLQSIFRLYDQYDVLASVSTELSEVNRSQIGPVIESELSKFVPLMNQIDPDSVRERSGEPLDEDLVAWFSSELPTLVTMGRLSLEKDQAKLLRAMAEVFAAGYCANLVLMGDGPLRADLEQLSAELGLSDHVYFAGQRDNPFPALRAAKCFVLSSNHEGQPMVLLESMIVGTPIIATDIVGSRTVLSENLDSIVENSVEGLSAGIIRLLERKEPVTIKFDPDTYRRTVREAFLSISGSLS